MNELALSPDQTDSQVEKLGLLATPFGQALRALAMTCDPFGRDQNLRASQCKFFTV